MSIEAMKQALEALDAGVSISPNSVLHDRFRAAIEQAEKVEPVAILGQDDMDGYLQIKWLTQDRTIGMKLYAHPPIPEGWQPIETAPKDGTPVLAILSGVHPETGKPYIPTVAEFDEEYGEWKDAVYSKDDLEAIGVGKWEPTHWMPLPAAPEVK